ncbi:MAG TPA: N-acetylmuramoyl-L-alanine amidase-like domain-containing protein [Longimicrobiales bacterium]
MIRRIAAIAPILALVSILAWWLGRRTLDPERRAVDIVAHAGGVAAAPASPVPDAVVTDRDREIFLEKMAWARAERLDTLPLGEIVARLGRTFVGTKYTPHTLEVDGPERLVVNLRELDCVTFVESTLAMARLIRDGEYDDFDAYKRELARIRYRGGVIDGYASRLHYFSDWIADGEAKGVVRNVTREIGGVSDAEPVDFMSTNSDAYRQLADPAVVDAIRRVEAEVSARARYFIPESRIADAAPRIRNGDIIAATSSIEGLDVAHTGIALWVDGRLHLLHAPLVGKSVEISELPLAERILDIDGQDGIMVARPV